MHIVVKERIIQSTHRSERMKPRLSTLQMCPNRRRIRLPTADVGALGPSQCAMVCNIIISNVIQLMPVRSFSCYCLLGSHMKHNEAEGDNVGPLLVKK